MSTLWTSSLPFTYEIGYAQDRATDPKFPSEVASGRPGLEHVGHDVPLNSATGNTIQFTPHEMRYLSAAEMPARIEELRAYVNRLHEAGARLVIPYIITMVIIGNPIKRTGFWQLFDRWEEFSPLGLGPKPDTDPLTWLQSGPRPMGQADAFAYETTISHPVVQRFLKVCVDLVAQCGYDGTFLDVNANVSWHEEDRKWFSRYLRDRYTPEELAALFAFPSYDDALLGHPGDSLLWFETQRFRSWAFGQLFATLRDVGRVRVPHFIVLPNNSPLCTIDGFYSRRTCGHELGQWKAGCDTIMFEEMQQAGRFGMDRINDDILQYKYALAHGMKGVLLLYNAKDPDAITLANAEAAAGGGGAFVQCGYEEAGTMRAWGDWFDRHRERFDGLKSVHDVGLVFFAEQMYWGNRAHIEAAYKVRQLLSDNHILFDLLVEPNFTIEALRSFSVVIVPELYYLSDAQASLLAEYVAAGGHAVLIGQCGVADDRGKPSAKPLLERLAGYGERVLHAKTIGDLVTSHGKDLFELSEDEFNDIAFVLGLPDRVSSFKLAQKKRDVLLIPTLEGLAGKRLRLLGDSVPFTVRISMFSDPKRNRLVAHLVNYNLPVRERGKSGKPVPVRNIRLNVPAAEARWWTPEGVEGEALQVDREGTLVPKVRLYAMVEITP